VIASGGAPVAAADCRPAARAGQQLRCRPRRASRP